MSERDEVYGADARAANAAEYPMKRMAVGFTITDDYWDDMTVTRMGWAWETKKLEAAGYWIDGGIWPWLRFVREAKLDDYLYGPLGENQLGGLRAALDRRDLP